VFLTVGLRFSLPAGSAYPLLSLLAAALVWFGATRLEAQPGRDQMGSDRMAGRDQTGRDRAGREPAGRDPGVNAADGYDRRAAPYPANGDRGPRAPGDLRPPGDRREFASPARPELPVAPPYGRILIFTLLDDRTADFDRLAEQAAEEVRIREPDTLVYVIHLVPNAPMQRIFYEIYRDRAAFDRHENQPYMKRFVADRRACVLATNVIELRLKYAKVAPLPSSPPGQPHPAPRPQSLEPLPPRPDRRLPSGDRRYGGI
jgi:quinol monooxygenase YgiN